MQLKIFVISMKKSTERRLRISTALSSMGLAFEIVDAVDGRCLPPMLHARPGGECPATHGGAPALLPGEIGCALSHVRCARLIEEQGLAGAIILEDDAIPLPPLRDFAFAFKASHPNYRPGSMIFLGGLEDESPKAFDRNRLIVRSLHRRIHLTHELSISKSIDSARFFLRACAYYVDADSAKRLASFNVGPRTVADDWRLFAAEKVVENIYLLSRWAVRHPFERESASLLEPERMLKCGPQSEDRPLSSINRQVKNVLRRPLRPLLALLW